MKRFASGAVRALALVALGAAPSFAQSSSQSPASSAESTVPDELQGMLGDWLLEQEDESAPTCPVTLTDQQSIGGWQAVFPEPCSAPYPPAASMLTWNVDPTDGAVLLMDAERHVTLRLLEDEDGLFATDPTLEPHFYLLPPDDADSTGGESDTVE